MTFWACGEQRHQYVSQTLRWRSFVTVRNITQSDVLDLHAEILSVFDADDIITPDQLRGNATSLKEALLTNGGRCALPMAAQSAPPLPSACACPPSPPKPLCRRCCRFASDG